MASTELLDEPQRAFTRRPGCHVQITSIESDVIYGLYAISSSAMGQPKIEPDQRSCRAIESCRWISSAEDFATSGGAIDCSVLLANLERDGFRPFALGT
jgi:hypothetical protein